ncbi:MAG: DNA recombination protein RmuC [Sphaerimonospora mesophila]
MEYIIIGLLVIVIVVLVWSRKPRETSDQTEQFLQNDLANLRRDIGSLSDNLRKTFDERLDKTQDSVHKQLSESSKIINDVSARLTKLDETNKRVVDVADELKTLQNILANPKQRGVFGEYYLASVLENVLPPNQWQSQYKFKDGEIVDAVIFLNKGKILPVDSKFSLENYNRFIEAADKTERASLLAKVKSDLKGRIDETAKYIRPSEGTMDFAFMFIPSESLYYDLLINNVGQGGSSRDLIEYAFRDKRVIITSPTSFMAYLETVLQGLRSLQIEEQAKEIQIRVGQLGQHLRKYEEYLGKLGNSLGTTVNHYNNAHKEFVKVDKDVVKIAGGETSVDPLLIDKPHGDN